MAILKCNKIQKKKHKKKTLNVLNIYELIRKKSTN